MAKYLKKFVTPLNCVKLTKQFRESFETSDN